MTVPINVYLNGVLHGMRHWPVIPRCGEHIWVENLSNAKRHDDPSKFINGWCVVRTVQYCEKEMGFQVNLYVTPRSVRKDKTP